MHLPVTHRTISVLFSTSPRSTSPHYHGHHHVNFHPTAAAPPSTTPSTSATSAPPTTATVAAQLQERLFAPPAPGSNSTTVIGGLSRTLTQDQISALTIGLQALASSSPSEIRIWNPGASTIFRKNNPASAGCVCNICKDEKLLSVLLANHFALVTLLCHIAGGTGPLWIPVPQWGSGDWSPPCTCTCLTAMARG